MVVGCIDGFCCCSSLGVCCIVVFDVGLGSDLFVLVVMCLVVWCCLVIVIGCGSLVDGVVLVWLVVCWLGCLC